LSNVRSLEALLLETIRVGGSEICSSPFAQTVMRGNWRQETPDLDERVNQLNLYIEMNRTTYETVAMNFRETILNFERPAVKW
jgi:hypothetical protein